MNKINKTTYIGSNLNRERHRQGEQAGRQVPRIRNLLQLHTSSATLSRGNRFSHFYLIRGHP